jgi:hypothetical protein
MHKCLPAFILCFELLAGKLDLRILPSDKPQTLGLVLLRLLPPRETCSKGLLMSILRICAANAALASTLPSFWGKVCEAKESKAQARKGGILGRITGLIADGFDATKINLVFLNAVCAALQKEREKLKWPLCVEAWSFSNVLDFISPSHNARLHQVRGGVGGDGEGVCRGGSTHALVASCPWLVLLILLPREF